MPGRDPAGLVWTVLIGIAGAWIAEFLGQAVHLAGQTLAVQVPVHSNERSLITVDRTN